MTKYSKTEKVNKAIIGIVPEELTEDNYEDWKSCLKHYLVGHGLWGVVSRKEPEPNRDEKEAHEEWKRKNALALHAIQLSCGASTYSKFKEAHKDAHFAWQHLAEKIKRRQHLQRVIHEPSSGQLGESGLHEHLVYGHLYKAIEENNLHATMDIIQQDPNAIRARVTSHKDTALHIAILVGHMKIAEELIKKMEPEDLGMANEYGATPLSLAAISGVTKLAKEMVRKNESLVSIENKQDDGHLPVIVAALYGQKRMVRYLYEVTPKEELKGDNGAFLLNSLITADIYDVASKLLIEYPELGVTPDHNGNYPLRILAHKPSAFPSGTHFVLWKHWIYSCVVVYSPWEYPRGSHELHIEHPKPNNMGDHAISFHDISDDETSAAKHEGMLISTKLRRFCHGLGWRILRCIVPDIKHIHDKKLVHDEAVKLLTCIFKEIQNLSKCQLQKMDLDKILYDAMKHGIVEFIEEILKYNPEIIWRKDKKGRSLFANAIVLRQENIFSLIYGLGTKKSIMARRHDIFGNNFLHLAAKLSPERQLERVSGAALQMQRELQWFKEVESIVQPRLKEDLNDNNKTPEMLFMDEHKKLCKEGEKWMKNTAGSSMIVGTLIAAVMFTTAFTVPGGNNSTTGFPVMLKTQPGGFWIFVVSNALSMFSSSTSLLMFLGILTARYAEEDFLVSMPTKLVFGLACLFLSIATMMVSFGASLYLIMNKQVPWVSYPIIILSTIPVALFTVLQFPLLIEIVNRTFGSGIFNKPRKKLFKPYCVLGA